MRAVTCQPKLFVVCFFATADFFFFVRGKQVAKSMECDSLYLFSHYKFSWCSMSLRFWRLFEIAPKVCGNSSSKK